MQNHVCLFFYVKGEFLIHSCDLSKAEPYGDFLVFPDSHFEIWEKHYARRYPVDFDYFPRGRVAYRKNDQTFLIHYDHCLDPVIHKLVEAHYTENIILGYDEHYQCHKCNPTYII